MVHYPFSTPQAVKWVRAHGIWLTDLQVQVQSIGSSGTSTEYARHNTTTSFMDESFKANVVP